MPPLSATVMLKDGRRAVLRRPGPEDAGALAELNLEAAEDYGNQVAEPKEAVTDRDLLAEMLQHEGFLLGGFVENTLAGTASLFVVSLQKIRHVAELGLVVRPSFKRLGLGRALLRAAIEEAPRRGLVKLVARVFAHNEPALALYRSMGFVEEGRQRRQYLFRDGTYQDGVLMALFLT